MAKKSVLGCVIPPLAAGVSSRNLGHTCLANSVFSFTFDFFPKKSMHTLWGICSVVMFSLLSKFRLPIGLDSSCSISPMAGGTVKKALQNITTERTPQNVLIPSELKSVSKVLGQMWALLALGWVSQDFWDRLYIFRLPVSWEIAWACRALGRRLWNRRSVWTAFHHPSERWRKICKVKSYTGWANWISLQKLMYFICCLIDLFLF